MLGKKRLVSVLLAIAVVLTLLPATVPAEEPAKAVRIGDQYFDTLQEAFDSVPDGVQTTVTLEKGFIAESTIELAGSKNVILDMNGKKITVNDSFAGRPLKNSGTLVIKGGGVIDTSMSDLGGYGAVDNYGVLTIENGTYTGSVNASGASIKNRPTGVLTINGGLFNGAVTALYNEGIAKVYNGEFVGTSCSSCNPNSWGYTIQSHQAAGQPAPQLYFYNGQVKGVQGAFSTSAGYSEVWDGHFETVPCQVHTNGSTAFYALYIAGESGEVECNIYGGEFKSATKVAAFIGNSNDGGQKKDAIANFHGGTFIAGTGVSDTIHVDKQLGGLEVTGGTYLLSDGQKDDVTQWLPAEGGDYSQDDTGTIIHNHAPNAEHVPAKTATCTEDGNVEYWYCKACNEYFLESACLQPVPKEATVIKARHHAVKTEAKPATCTEGGNDAYWYCGVCEKYFSDEACTEEISLDDALIPASGHGEIVVKNSKEATCTEEGYTGDKVCVVCQLVVEKGEVIPKTAHSFQDGKCTVCGAVEPDNKPVDPEEPSNPDGGDSQSPQTGSPTVLPMLTVLFLLSGGAAAALLVIHKRKKA